MGKSLSASGNAWLARIGSSRSPVVRLVCFPYAGGGPSAFARWQDSMPREAEILAVHLPGREWRMHEEPCSSFATAVHGILAAVKPLEPLPTVYFGHSLGGLIAFETARLLEAEGHRAAPLRLLLSGCSPPHIEKDREEGPAWKLDDTQFIEELKKLNGTPEEVLNSPEALDLFMPLLRSDFRLADEARASIRSRTSIPVAALGGWDDDVTQEELQEWHRYAAALLSVQMFPGDHFFLNTHRESVCSTVRAHIADTLLGSGGRAHGLVQEAGA